jgi:hypothetical protein
MIFDEIWRMERRQNRRTKIFFKQIEVLKKDYKKTPEQIDIITEEAGIRLNELSLHLDYAKSDAIIKEAYRLKVPTPSKTDKEAWDDFFGRPYLTNRGYSDLRSKIRQERKERRETATAIVKDIISPLGALIISILSLMIAYAALKLKH